MSDPHARFEQLAVGHVLGGLPRRDAAAFRGHLIECRECRTRVAELRDIAADLEAAERDERRRARTKLETARREESEPDETASGEDDRTWPTPRSPGRGLVILIVGLIVGVLAFGAWSFHLRTVNAGLLAVSERQEAVMETLATGTIVATNLHESTRGRVAVTDEIVALTLTEVPEPASDQRLVVWLVSDGDSSPVFVGARAGSEGRVAWAGERDAADQLVVTLEAWPPEEGGDEPRGTILVDADLTTSQAQRGDHADAEPRASFVRGRAQR